MKDDSLGLNHFVVGSATCHAVTPLSSAFSVSSVVKARSPGAVIDGVSSVDCIFRGVRATEVVEANGSIPFRNVKIEPAEKGRSLDSRPTWP